MDSMDTTAGTSIEPLQIFSYSNTDVGRILRDLEGDASFLSVPFMLDLKINFEFES